MLLGLSFLTVAKRNICEINMLPDFFSSIQQHTELCGQVQRTPAKRVICTSVYYLGEYLTERHEIDYSDYPHLMPRFVLDDTTCAKITSVSTLAHLPNASKRRLFYFASLFIVILTNLLH